ncbi:hypothetical protein ACGGZK_06645 [Agromyces sp. MMS24-K17]|uniref:hypothetical protein n=1 Tax=Agromyces sp. MMS24-K17 TaxID=3372850 RepID=UPI0037546AF1
MSRSSTRKRRRRGIRYRPENTSPATIVVSTFVGLFGLAAAVLCVWVVVDAFRAGTGLFDAVGVARPTPLWFALIGCALGFVVGLRFAWDWVTYVVRTIRKTPKLVAYFPDAEAKAAAAAAARAQARAAWWRRVRRGGRNLNA